LGARKHPIDERTYIINPTWSRCLWLYFKVSMLVSIAKITDIMKLIVFNCPAIATGILNVSLISISSNPESRPDIMDASPDNERVIIMGLNNFEIFLLIFRIPLLYLLGVKIIAIIQ
jgi:hypothetical protein